MDVLPKATAILCPDRHEKSTTECQLLDIRSSGQIRWRWNMRSMIQAVCGTGMVLAVSLVGMPASAHAQYTNRTHGVSGTTRIHHHRVVTHRTHILCADGTWARSGNTDCVGHDGIAARQVATISTPRASERARVRASTNSAVVSGYSNGVRRRAIARCADGTYWHARRRAGACVDHGGVARWY